MPDSSVLLAQPAGLRLRSGECVELAGGLALTSDCRAGRRSSQGDTHCLGPASPSRKLGSACCRRHSFLWCQKACQGTHRGCKGLPGSCLHPEASPFPSSWDRYHVGLVKNYLPYLDPARLSFKTLASHSPGRLCNSQSGVDISTLHPFPISTRVPRAPGWALSKGSRPTQAYISEAVCPSSWAVYPHAATWSRPESQLSQCQRPNCTPHCTMHLAMPNLNPN